MSDYYHRWSGWPGAYCLKCGAQELMEQAVADCAYDPHADTWESDEVKQLYMQAPCPVSDQDYEDHIHQLGHPRFVYQDGILVRIDFIP